MIEIRGGFVDGDGGDDDEKVRILSHDAAKMVQNVYMYFTICSRMLKKKNSRENEKNLISGRT